MSRVLRYQKKKKDDGPLLKINFAKFPNLPKIREEEDRLQGFINSFESDSQLSLQERSCQLRTMTASFSRGLKTTSSSRDKKEQKKVDENYTIYGLSKIKTARSPLQSQRQTPNPYETEQKLERSNEEWFQQSQISEAPQAKVLFFNQRKKSFLWEDAKVINYNQDTQKFLVQKYPDGQTKSVDRLSIKFINQDEELFRVATVRSQNIRQHQKEEMKRLREINAINDSEVNKAPQTLINSLFNRFQYSKKQHLVETLLEEVNQNYLLFQKKCSFIEDASIYKQVVHIEQRYQYYSILQNNLEKEAILLRKDGYKAMKQLMFRLNQINIEIIHQRDFKFPIILNKFDTALELEGKEIKKEIRREKFYIQSDLQDILGQNYKFVESNRKRYYDCGLSRILTKVDLMYQQIIKEKVLHQFNYTKEFYESFILNSQFQKSLNQKPLLQLHVQCIVQVPVKKSMRKLIKDSIKGDEEIIYIEPNLQSILTVLIKPFDYLYQLIIEGCCIQSEIMTLLLLEKKKLSTVMDFPQLNSIKEQTITQISNEYKSCDDIVKYYNKYSHYLKAFRSKDLYDIFGLDPKEAAILSQMNFQSIESYLYELKESRLDILSYHQNQKRFGLFSLNIYELKHTLVERINEQQTQIFNKIQEILKHNIQQIKQQFQVMRDKSQQIPQTEQELMELKLFLGEIKVDFSRMQFEVQFVEQYLNLFEEFYVAFDFQLVIDYYELIYLPKDISDIIEANKAVLKQQEDIFLRRLHNDKQEFIAKILQMQATLTKIKSFSQYEKLKEYIIEIKKFQEQIENSKEIISEFNLRELTFQIGVTVYREFDNLVHEFQPYYQFWDLAQRYDVQKEQWLSVSIKQLDHLDMQLLMQQFNNEAIQIFNYFTDILDDNAQSLVRNLRRQLDQFKDNIWIVESLAIEAYKRKPIFWKDLFRECSFPQLENKEEITISNLLKKGILNYKDIVLKLSSQAEKSWSVEKRLNEMFDKLSIIELELQVYKDTFIFKNYEDVMAQLDEQLNVLNILKAQPHAKFVIIKAGQLENKILLIQDTLDQVMKCQKHWIYLDPIFASDDIKQKLKQETLDFKRIDQSYKNYMIILNKNKLLWDQIENDKMKQDFAYNVQMLDQIQKSLTKYLESKRILFPRFYFVSDEELVEILAQTKNPQQVQKHIFKCFENISELKIVDNEVITAFYSSHQEKILLDDVINLKKGNKIENVESWLSEFQTRMQKTVKKASCNALKDLNSTKMEIINKWPGQSVLLSNQIKWTRNTEASIRQQQKLNLKLLVQLLNKELQTTVDLVRNETRLIQKTTLEAMVIQEVHNKDVAQILLNQQIEVINSFLWISQLRYYYNDENSIQVRMVNSSFEYGYEYLGKIQRLVITALTDRCQRTLMEAYKMNYGGAPEGPAGTGKTETVKDLAKAMARPCIVFNCSDGLNYIAMGKFFKGLVTSGSWCCFDEFNRIDPEVLSVVAQQIFTIQKAIKLKQEAFIFEGEEINLVPTCAINVTMNPGYAGRSELPDNLKILFRPCAMMVADYEMIGEIFLYSIGFERARELSKQIVTCLKLCNEQLSSQEHYDFGMRTLKAVLNSIKNTRNGTEQEKCLTALIIVNQPKLVKNDIELFKAITQDSFPNVQEQELDKLNNVQQQTENMKLIYHETLAIKCEQIHNSIEVRNGVMLVGQTFSGKSTSLQILSHLLKATILKLNPKAINSDQLYGKLDPDTKQWSDGVAPILIRENIQREKYVWIVFDGPVDSIWIENLNTVLDDNKKLCLTSGEILKIPERMCMIFEVENLSAASPATVSRLGMIYYSIFDWRYLIDNIRLPNHFDHKYFIKRIKYLIEHSLVWMQENAQFPVYDQQNILVSSFLKLFQKLMSQLDQNESDTFVFDNTIIFSITWSLGAAINEQNRNHFNTFLHKLLKHQSTGLNLEINRKLQFPINERIDYFLFGYINQKWIEWIDISEQLQITPSIDFHQIVVPTNESNRNDYFCKLGLHFLYCGPTGTGKSLSMTKFSQFLIACSGQTTGNSLQRLIETRINKRRRKGCYGAEEGQITIFVDELNMPFREPQGSQPAIELLRQWMDQGGWYDLDNKEFKYMCDITFLCAMQPASGGRNQITMRYLRHFNLLYIGGFDTISVTNILQVFVDWVMIKFCATDEIKSFKEQLVQNSLNLYQQIQESLLPTPQKCHYIYNLRDVFRIFEGMSKASRLQSKSHLMKLWVHECTRIFSDRLVDFNDIKIFQNIIKQIVVEDRINLNNILWIQGNSNQHYDEVQNIQQLKQRVQGMHDDFNAQRFQSKLSLILFTNAIMHIFRITRILQQTFGHALLIGIGGTGRSSLAKLATFIVFRSEPIIIDPRSWNDELLNTLLQVGLENQKASIIFNDSQLQQSYMWEDICSLLSHGEVTHLFTPEERLKIQEEMPFSKFLQICKFNVHVILCMQPVTELYRKRLRTFPTIINCTTIDWFMDWSNEALVTTAEEFLPNPSLVNVAVNIHCKVLEITQKYNSEQRRQFYVTPTQYLQMLQTFKRLQREISEQSLALIDRFESGIEKIIKTQKEVDKIKLQLFELQPQLEQATIENQKLLQRIKLKKEEADQKRRLCEYDEMICQKHRDQATELKNICITELNKVLPLLGQATEALDKITKEDMIQLKSFTNPPLSAAVVMEGLCYAFQEDEKVKSKNKELPVMQDYWDYAKKYLLNDKLIKRVKKMKLEEIRSIKLNNIQKLQIFVLNPLFEKEKVFNASKAAGNLAQWIRAVLETYQAVEIIEPKKAQLVEAEKKLKEAEADVQIKRAILEQQLNELKQFEKEFEKANQEKQIIQQEVETIQKQLNKAEKLLFGLQDEAQRWKKKGQKIKNEQIAIEGDCILSASIIAYLGVFPIQYRDVCQNYWKNLLKQNNVKFSIDYAISKQLCNPIIINNWITQQLPNDQLSIENAIILKESTKWPLMIDPQLQANQWIKNMEDSKYLLILNANQPTQQIQLQLEHGIQIGYAVLLENVGQTLDPLFESLLQQNAKSRSKRATMKLGDKIIDISSDFRFYMTTKLSNPHFQPQVCVMVNMLIFQVTQDGLVDQLLNIVVKIDEPQKEEQRLKNIQQYFQNKDKLIQTETLILKLLSESTGDLLENEDLIQTLSKSKDESIAIEEKLKSLEYDRINFMQIRQFYQQAAEKVANLYFILNDLAVIEHTYIWSLEFYFFLYTRSIRESLNEKLKRNQNIIDKFIQILYTQINRSLLEKDKLIFRFLLYVKMMNIPSELIRATVMGCTLTTSDVQMPKGFSWLTNKMWLELVDLSKSFPNIFGSICQDFVSQKQFWDSFQNSSNSYQLQLRGLDQFQMNMLVKIIKPEQFISATNEMIKQQMGNLFIENIPTTFEQFYFESDSKIPLLCIITPGADPRQEIIKLATKYDFNDRFNQISLGQGQNQLAIKMILNAMQQGTWVLLQNCHLAASFMPELENLFEVQYKKEMNSDFRLWLTSQPTSILPHNVILRSLKITYELPRGLKNNMLRSYQQQESDKFEQSKKLKEWKNLFFSLALLHACLLERKKYGPLGWNIGYNFSQHDFEISKEQIHYFLETYQDIPWDALNYLIAENNYGGRVTDPMDRKLLKIYVNDFINSKTIQQDYQFYDIYQIPQQMKLKAYMEYISQLPIFDPPQLFGLHQNAEIYSSILETENLSQVILQLLPRTQSDSNQTHPDQIVYNKSQEILKNLPEQLDSNLAKQKFQQILENPLNAIIHQEITKYNKLLTKISESLIILIQGLDGLINISDQSIDIYNAIFDNRIPEQWLTYSYLTTKSLGSWFSDLIQRTEFIKKWINQGQPKIFWLGGLFFIQGFLTAVLQTYSRKSKIPIDQLKFEFNFFSQEPQTITRGVCVNGISIDGAQFDYQEQTLIEPQNNILFYPCPIINFCPTQQRKIIKNYSCPLYNTTQRKGILTSNGISVNFICKIKIPINNNKNHWSKRGVAFIVQAN
ncbi:unnamed protein product [Paramecium primaurelia]|uniref:AAA+ ATPase domain-containing protein n=1 Tax=Paramecium primaurelia TaxID=5886 RepID=A0A8S1JPM0_PARPR|nr:unnamed protein product [Paramecium primaurelia]